MVPKNAASPFGGASVPAYNPLNLSSMASPIAPGVPTTQVTRTMPNGAGTYQSPVIAQPSSPAAPPAAPAFQPQPAPAAAATPAGVDYSRYTDPATGRVLSPQEYASMLASRMSGGSVPNYAGNAMTQGPQTAAQLTSTATDLNNERNDIAVGASDPYKVASKSGIAYSPADMAAIEKAYAGIYDPAIKDVFAKLEAKQKEDSTARESKSKLEQMAQQHKYDIELKQTPTGSSGNLSGIYTPGADPTVDAYADAVLNQKSKLENIPEEYRGAVAQAIMGKQVTPEASPYLSSIASQGRSAVKGLLDIAETSPGIFGSTAAAPVPLFLRSDAYRNYEGQLEYLKGNIIPAALTSMREASKTGGALGQVSDREGAWLASSLGALAMTQTPDAVIKQLRLIDESLARWENAVKGAVSSGAGTGFVVTDPDGGVHQFPDQASADEFKKAIGQ